MAGRLLKVLCALALVVNALIPAGFMLARAHGGDVISIVICTGYGPQTILVDGEGNQLPDDQDKDDHKRCDFAPVGALALANDAPVRLVANVRYAAVNYRVARDVFRATARSGAVWARGPPSELI